MTSFRHIDCHKLFHGVAFVLCSSPFQILLGGLFKEDSVEH